MDLVRYRRLGSKIAAIAVAAMALMPPGGRASGAAPARPPVECVAVGTECLLVEVASDPGHRAMGLRGRPTLWPFDGMLFVYEADTGTAFTMSGVLIPLTIGFYDSGGAPVGRLDMEPCSGAELACPLYRPPAPFRYALEVDQGHLPDGRLASGDLRCRALR